MKEIDQAIERSSLGTLKARAARQTVSRANATRIVAASKDVENNLRVGWGETPTPAPIRRRGGSNRT